MDCVYRGTIHTKEIVQTLMKKVYSVVLETNELQSQEEPYA